MTPIYRSVYRAQAQAGQEAAAQAHFRQVAAQINVGLTPGDLLTISLFRWGAHFLVYWESIEQALAPETLFGALTDHLVSWPGGATLQPPLARTFVPMMDIFHYLAPESVEHWRRKRPSERISGRVARLKPEMVSSYIFYHYQLQEEQPGRVDKYGIISLHENLIFFYQEQPAIVEEPRRMGKLTTSHTPPNWHEVMFPHFQLWEDAPTGQEIWREVALIFHK